MLNAIAAAQDAARLQWEVLKTPSCVRVQTFAGGPWIVAAEYG
jgi:hypothetical protein